MPKQTLQPVALQERIQTLDIIRGFALFGILTINFTIDHGLTEPWKGFSGFADQLVYWPIAFFMNDKFLAIYAFLFGLGFSIQMLRAKDHNSPFIFVYMRRLIVLYIIGVIHQILTKGDILRDYAMVGVLLLLLHKLLRKLLPLLAVLCFLVPWTRDTFFNKEQQPKQFNSNRTEVTIDTAILNTYVGVYEIEPGRRAIVTRERNKLFGEGRGGRSQWFAESETDFFTRTADFHFSFIKDSNGTATGIAMYLQNGKAVTARRIQMDIQQAVKEMTQQKAGIGKETYKQFVVKNANDFWLGLKNWSWSNFFWGDKISEILPLFLMGLYAGRRKIFYDISSNRQFLRKVMKWGLLIGMTSFAIALGFDAWNFANDIKKEAYSILTRSLIGFLWDLGVMITAIAYVAGLTLLLENIDWKKRLSFLAPVGRMGLTNYLLQAIAGTIILEGFGFDLDGKIGPFWRLMLVVPVFSIIFFVSHWWFKRFRIGPAEWLWRSLTYLKFQPMRLKDSDKVQEIMKENI